MDRRDLFPWYQLRYWKMHLKEVLGLTTVCKNEICIPCSRGFCNVGLLEQHIKKRHGIDNWEEWALYWGNARNPNAKYLNLVDFHKINFTEFAP